jgi:PTS system mannose-specific IID component
MSNEKKFTPKDIKQMAFRWTLFRSLVWNYETMQGEGYGIVMAPLLEKLYADDESARLHAYDVESKFFNCETNLAEIIFGVDAAIQEKEGEKGLEMVQAVKTSLMGPFSGIGDTLFSSVIGTILGSIAVTTGLNGNYIGTIIWFCYNVFVLVFLRPWLANLGYQQGARLITTLSDKLAKLTKAGTILGLTVIGSMIATMVKVNFSTVTLGAIEFNLQTQLLDVIMPKLASAAVVAFCYWFLGKYGMKSTRLILVVIVLAILFSFLKVLVP